MTLYIISASRALSLSRSNGVPYGRSEVSLTLAVPMCEGYRSTGFYQERMTSGRHTSADSDVAPVQAHRTGFDIAPVQAHRTGFDVAPVQAHRTDSDVAPVQAHRTGFDIAPVQAHRTDSDVAPVQAHRTGFDVAPVQAHRTDIDVAPVQERKTPKDYPITSDNRRPLSGEMQKKRAHHWALFFCTPSEAEDAMKT
ncbi:DUF1720 domain-containing protein [Paraburkholderia xenovorans]